LQKLKYYVVLSIMAAFVALVSAQTQPPDQAVTQASPQMPAISSPKMPSVTVPSIGNSFYSPIHAPLVPPAPIVPQQAQIQSVPAQPSVSAFPTESAALPRTTSSALTANRLSELGALAGLSGLSSLFSDQDAGSGMDSESINIVLQNLLARLETLERAMPAATTQTAAKQGAQILRFKINGTDVLPSCRDIYFSSVAPSGVFLFTGDRKFTFNQQIHDETFYFLFRPKAFNPGSAEYDVAISVSENNAMQSYMQLLASYSPLSASRTGNLVTIRCLQNDVNLDLLIDMGQTQE